MASKRGWYRVSWTPKRIVLICVLSAIIAALAGYLILRGVNIDVLNPQGVVADKQRSLIIFTTLLGLAVIIPVFTMLFVFAWRYREGNPKKQKYTPNADGNHLIEAIWWGIPVVIIVILSVVTWFTTHDLDPYNKLKSDNQPITIRVVALQWKWMFIYPEQQVVSVNEVRFPENTPINFEITADAPMSAFWIPSLGSQIYAMNGMVSKLSLMADKTGEYRGTNTNISGEGYSQMDFKAISTSRAEFNQWVKVVTASDNHMTWQEYEKLAEPSINQPVQYYHLHDSSIFNRIINKYMGDGHTESMSDEGSHTHIDMEGE